jgi:beta-lactamase regulating signal transducer with metallopeptidase domain
LRTLHLLVLLSLLFPNLPARAAAPAPDETSAIAPRTQAAANVPAQEASIIPATQALTTTLEPPVESITAALPVTATLETLPVRIPISGGVRRCR